MKLSALFSSNVSYWLLISTDHKLQLPIFDIRPSESQLVFQGDKLPFECHASVTPGKMEIAWFRGGQLVTTNKTIGVFVYTSHNLDRTVINHRLVVESLDSSHAGEWSCVVSTDTGNLTKTVSPYRLHFARYLVSKILH